jgi:hypothetical protein
MLGTTALCNYITTPSCDSFYIFWLKLTRTQATKITDWVKPGDTSGEFKRQQSSFRNWISREPGAQFPPEKGRYHLYVSYACPWVSISWQRSAG